MQVRERGSKVILSWLRDGGDTSCLAVLAKFSEGFRWWERDVGYREKETRGMKEKERRQEPCNRALLVGDQRGYRQFVAERHLDLCIPWTYRELFIF